MLLVFLFAALSLDERTGNFKVGKDFDALRVNVAAPGGPIDVIQNEKPQVCGLTHKVLKTKNSIISITAICNHWLSDSFGEVLEFG